MKHDVQAEIGRYISHLPRMSKPVTIDFLWTERDRRRDFDNISGAGRKFILDALVASGKLPDDNRKFVTGFSDAFELGEDYKVTLTIKEVEDDTEGATHSRNATARRSNRKDKV